MSNKIIKNNLLTVLDIKYKNLPETISNLTDEQVAQAYLKKLIDFYIRLNEFYVHNRNQLKNETKQDIKNRIQNQLLAQISNVPLNVQIIILENKIIEYGLTDNEQRNIDLYFSIIRDAYDALKSPQGRSSYLATLNKVSLTHQDLTAKAENIDEPTYNSKKTTTSQQQSQIKIPSFPIIKTKITRSW